MSAAISQQISLFLSQIENRRFDGGALRILESILVAKDVRSLIEIRSAVRDLLRSEITTVLGEIAEKSTYEKLYTVDFFVKAFAFVGDTENCLALKYEAFVLREKSQISDHGLRVSFEEWSTFAKDSLDSGFYAIAVKGFENALLSIQSCSNIEDQYIDTLEKGVIDDIQKLRDMAAALIASNSVRTESAKYLKRKAVHDKQMCTSSSSNSQQVASIMYRSGIKKRNLRRLQQSQGLLPNTSSF